MDEVPKQLLSDFKEPIFVEPERAERFDYAYQRHGVANLFMFFAPFLGQRHVKVTKTRTRLDWALAMRELSDNLYPEAEKIIVVLDNLNTHTPAASTWPLSLKKPGGLSIDLSFTSHQSTEAG
jgi:hypothetical protein